MNIIFGDPIESIPNSFTILPLDSFRVEDGELDTFYTDLLQRVIAFKQTPPAEDWDGLRIKV